LQKLQNNLSQKPRDSGSHGKLAGIFGFDRQMGMDQLLPDLPTRNGWSAGKDFIKN